MMPLQLIFHFDVYEKKKEGKKPHNIKMKHYKEQFWFISLGSYSFCFPWTLFSYILFPKVISDAK